MTTNLTLPAPTGAEPVPPGRAGAPGSRPGDAGPRTLLHAMLVVGLLAGIGPFIWMVLGSVKPEAEIRRVPPTWWPHTFTLDNYRQLFQRLDFLTYFVNSTLVAVLVTAGNVLVCAALGYALAKLDFPGRRLLFAMVLGMLMVPTLATFVPQFVLVSQLGMVNTYAGLVLPMLAMAGPLGAFLMRQYIVGIPDELLEAARVDGAGELRVFWQVVLPLCRPAIATVAIFTFLNTWNNFLWPLVVATTEDKYTLPVALALFSIGQNRTQYGLLLAGAVVVVLPVLVVFMVLQRHFVRGIATTGLK
jgi:multiple sugar transport system permease protein